MTPNKLSNLAQDENEQKTTKINFKQKVNKGANAEQICEELQLHFQTHSALLFVNFINNYLCFVQNLFENT